MERILMRLSGIYLLGMMAIGSRMIYVMDDRDLFRYWEPIFLWYCSPIFVAMVAFIVGGILGGLYLLLFGEV